VDAPEVRGRSRIPVDVAQLPAERTRRGARVPELTKGRQHDPLLPEALRGSLDSGWVDDF